MSVSDIDITKRILFDDDFIEEEEEEDLDVSLVTGDTYQSPSLKGGLDVSIST